ncbi:MAG: glycosyltransferase [Bacteroidales bacterium]|nr:glycosyltransferase [Bacteroidales bacterium]
MIQPAIYHILHMEDPAAGQRRYRLRLDAAHRIYQAHFPGNPITPGACMIDICRDLLSAAAGRPIRIHCIRNIKFLALLNPVETPEVEVELIWLEKDGAMDCKATFLLGEMTFAKLSMNCAADATGSADSAGDRQDPSTLPEETSEMPVGAADCRTTFDRLKTAVLIPAYNHSGTVWQVVREVVPYCRHIIVVDDGSVPPLEIPDRDLSLTPDSRVELLSHTPNRGKGYALRQGFAHAAASGCEHVVTMDADLQHRASDLPRFAAACQVRPDALLLGARPEEQPGKPRKNTFANRFSNFWVWVQTGTRLPDTQTGFRMYPLRRLLGMRLNGNRYEAEAAWIVRLLWRGTEVVSVPVEVDYTPPGGRISHFRKCTDFLRISLMNTGLCFAALCYGYPSMWFRRKTRPVTP